MGKLEKGLNLKRKMQGKSDGAFVDIQELPSQRGLGRSPKASKVSDAGTTFLIEPRTALFHHPPTCLFSLGNPSTSFWLGLYPNS